jgi:hypothetical protein
MMDVRFASDIFVFPGVLEPTMEQPLNVLIWSSDFTGGLSRPRSTIAD